MLSEWEKVAKSWQSNKKRPWGEIHVLNSQARNLKLSNVVKLSVFELHWRLSHMDNISRWLEATSKIHSHFLQACQIQSPHEHAHLKFRHVCAGEEVFLQIMTFCKHGVGLIWALACPQLLQCCQFLPEGCWLSSSPPRETWQTAWPKGLRWAR